MVSIRFHGRGGQGAVIASKLLARAMFEEGWQVQAFPSFGAERTGAPVAAFLRADHQPITLHCQIYAPDGVVVLDPLLIRALDVTSGLMPGGWLLINAPRLPDQLALPPMSRVATCDATTIALSHGLGTRTRPIVNTAVVGALSAVTGLVSIDAVLDAIAHLVPAHVEANRAAARAAFDAMGSVTLVTARGEAALAPADEATSAGACRAEGAVHRPASRARRVLQRS
jgi:pyruvate ferredoxin oxidoreductase gamma subunit/2-oxoisovalerate ferredoxin oxidoreductase gamma subunit